MSKPKVIWKKEEVKEKKKIYNITVPEFLYKKLEEKDLEKKYSKIAEKTISGMDNAHSDDIPGFPKLRDSLISMNFPLEKAEREYQNYFDKGVDYFWFGYPRFSNFNNGRRWKIPVDSTGYLSWKHEIGPCPIPRETKHFRLLEHGYCLADYNAAYVFQSEKSHMRLCAELFLISCPAELLTSIELRSVANLRAEDHFCGDSKLDNKYSESFASFNIWDKKPTAENFPWIGLTPLKVRYLLRHLVDMLDYINIYHYVMEKYNIPYDQAMFTTEHVLSFFVVAPRIVDLFRQIEAYDVFKETITEEEVQDSKFFTFYQDIKKWMENPYDFENYSQKTSKYYSYYFNKECPFPKIFY